MATEDPPVGKRKGSIPTWAWIVGGTIVVAGAWFFWKNRQSSTANTAQQSASTTAPTDNPAGLSTDQYESLLALLRDIQGTEGNETNPTNPPPTQPGSTKPFGPNEVINVDYVIGPSESYASIAKKYGISQAHLQNNNPNIQGKPGQKIKVPYLVRQGDTEASVAKKFGISVQHLQQMLTPQGITA